MTTLLGEKRDAGDVGTIIPMKEGDDILSDPL
jgi:hypothetical protein